MKTDTFLIYVTIEIFLAEKIIYKTQTVPNTYFHYKKYFILFFFFFWAIQRSDTDLDKVVLKLELPK